MSVQESFEETNAFRSKSEPMLETVRELTQEKIEDVRKNVLDFARKYQSQASKYVENVNRYVKENPIQAIVLGFGTGVLLGAFLRSRREASR